MNILPAWNWAAAQVKAYRAQSRFCLRMTVAALLAFALTQLLAIPLHGLWAVLTAVVVTQVSVGGSLRAAAEYVVGTLGGVVYATLVGVLVPHTTPLALAGVLALTVAALIRGGWGSIVGAFGASEFRVASRPVNCLTLYRRSSRARRRSIAPFTAVIVLLISNELGEGPLESALYRLLEVALGGAVAVTVSLLVFPERAYGLGLDAATRALDQLAQVLPELLADFSRKLDLDEVRPACEAPFSYRPSLMIGHHFSMSAFCTAASASGVCSSRGKSSSPRSANRARTSGAAKASTVAAFSLSMIGFGVPWAQKTRTKP
jgi:hypothetical protein